MSARREADEALETLSDEMWAAIAHFDLHDYKETLERLKKVRKALGEAQRKVREASKG